MSGESHNCFNLSVPDSPVSLHCSQTPVGPSRLASEDDRCRGVAVAGGFRLLAGASIRPRSLSRRLVARRCCPRLSQLRGPLTINRLSGLNHAAFALAVYASQLSFSRGNCTATQNSLPAGGQPLPGAIGYPQNYSVKFQSSYLHDFPLTQASPGATRPAVYESTLKR